MGIATKEQSRVRRILVFALVEKLCSVLASA